MQIQSFTSQNTVYQTTPEHCTCGDWTWRKSKTGGQCKHQIWLADRQSSLDAISQAIREERRRVEREETAASYYRMSLAS